MPDSSLHRGRSRRVALTLPEAFLADLSYVSYRFGVSKSAIVADLLTEPLRAMRSVLVKVSDPLDRLSDEERALIHGLFAGLVGAALQEGQELYEILRQGRAQEADHDAADL